jgi:hypothetical protein
LKTINDSVKEFDNQVQHEYRLSERRVGQLFILRIMQEYGREIANTTNFRALWAIADQIKKNKLSAAKNLAQKYGWRISKKTILMGKNGPEIPLTAIM